MPIKLSPICKTLIQFFACSATPFTITEIEKALESADPSTLRDELHMLVRADVVRQAIRRADERLVYWLAGAPIEAFDGTQYHYPPDPTFADVGGIERIAAGVQHA